MRLTAILLVFLFLSSGCGVGQQQGRLFELSNLSYERALRWGDFNKALAFHQGRNEPLDEATRAELKQIRVTAYDIVYARRVGENEIEQVVEVKYYLEDRAVERETTFDQRWEFDPEKKSWYLTSPFPEFQT